MTDLLALIARAGRSTIPYVDPAFPDRPLLLHAARPEGWTPAMPIVFSHHGRSRNGADYRDYFLPLVDALGLLVIAPTFSDESFPGQALYNAGNLQDADGRPNPAEACTYAIMPRLFAALQQQGVTTAPRYGLFGHSAGAQFVHRQVTFGYAQDVAIAVSANAGTYTMPDREIAFPYGLSGTDAALEPLLSFPLVIMAGTADSNPDEQFVPRDPGSLRQGAHRYERAHRYMVEGRHAAERLGMACAWSIIDVPGVAHDGKRMAEAAAPVLGQALHR
ncbi:alpha/beta hydrolase [Acidisphaera sp. L21]|jgi:poly(3-hydroxybutyrate) depolymerase|uniref:alpha/beta hydrolase n=1 Tax=Acidisphaera sp. L21 TaxID=1641851 RepID=UPI00131CE0FF|nr:alpha/beta hydrolase [Acidisphaera sp. L21]